MQANADAGPNSSSNKAVGLTLSNFEEMEQKLEELFEIADNQMIKNKNFKEAVSFTIQI